MQVQTSGRRFDDDGRDASVLRRRRSTRSGACPASRRPAFTSQLPLSGDLRRVRRALRGHADAAGRRRYSVYPLRGEPGLHRDDGHSAAARPAARRRTIAPGAPLVALISESLAQRQVPRPATRSASGCASVRPTDRPYTIVGVVGDVKQVSLALSESDAVYITTDAVALRRHAHVARRPRARRRGGARARRSAGDLVGRQGSTDRARRDDGRRCSRRRRRSGASR